MARPVSEPVPTVATAGAISLVQPFLVKFYRTGTARPVSEPIDTITAKARFGLVQPQLEIDGQRYLIDIRFRMLKPRELASAQGFPATYQFTGNTAEVVRQIGNAVPTHLAEALVRAAITQPQRN